jgi:hypothetical protein
MKIFTVIGARPQFIKAAVVSRAFKEHRPDVHEVLVHTGQHNDANISDVFFEELNIPHPNHNQGAAGIAVNHYLVELFGEQQRIELFDHAADVLAMPAATNTLTDGFTVVPHPTFSSTHERIQKLFNILLYKTNNKIPQNKF